MTLIRPGFGIPRPNAAARRAGLHFALDFSHSEALPWIRGGEGAVSGTLQSGAIRGTTQSGWAMVGANGFWRAAGASVSYSLPTTAGTILTYAHANFASNDGLEHTLFSNENAFPSGPTLDLLKWSDNNCYFGWIASGDKRITFPAAGLWTAGETFTAGVTWDSSGQVAYVKGVSRGSNASSEYASTAGFPLTIGGMIGNSWFWNRADGDAIFYVLIFDRVFAPAEMARAESDPWWWLDAPAFAPRRIGQQVVNLTALGISTGAPAVGVPTVGQVHALTATGIATGAPTVGTPTLAQVHALTASGLATGAPTLGTPTLAQVHALTATGIATGAPAVGTPILNASPSTRRTLRLPARDRNATLGARDRTTTLPGRNRIHPLQPERT